MSISSASLCICVNSYSQKRIYFTLKFFFFSFSNNSEKKQNLLANSSKSSFLPHGFFDKSSKGRMHTTQNSSGASNYGKKPAENMKLLSDKDNKKHPLFEDNNDDDDNDEEDSDDEWCVPRLGGYQKVRPCAE